MRTTDVPSAFPREPQTQIKNGHDEPTADKTDLVSRRGSTYVIDDHLFDDTELGTFVSQIILVFRYERDIFLQIGIRSDHQRRDLS